jgi:hypothetical protein
MMMTVTSFDGLEVGYDIPALPGMAEADIQTPCLVLDLDALERNVAKMGALAAAMGVVTGCMARCTNRWMWPCCRNGWAGLAGCAARR